MADLAYYLKISNHLAGNLDIRSALRSVKIEIDMILPIDHLDVCLIDEDGAWNTSYEVGLKTSWSTFRQPIEVSPVRDVLRGMNDGMLTGNAMEDPRYMFEGAASEPILIHQLRSRVNVPMRVLGRTIGSLNCSSRTADKYDDANVLQVRNIADILAPYFYALRATEKAKKEAIIRTKVLAREEGLRLGALSLTEALEAERQRIGMDLHDQTLAELTRISRDLGASGLGAGSKELQRRMQDCIQGLRDIIETSIPSILELFGFQHAVRTHLQRAAGAPSLIKLDVHDHTNGAVDDLPDATRTALFRIAQEAINNSVQHANASMIVVEIGRNGGIWLMITDDGGSRQKPVQKKQSGGLTHMRTRARLIGAEFEITHEGGTTIRVHLPPVREELQEGSD